VSLNVSTHGPLDEYRELTARKMKAVRERFPNGRPMCKSCAFRKGTEASRDATLRAEFAAAVEGGGLVVFYCHEEHPGRVEGDESTYRLCAGYCAAISEIPV
jgi:hypothetical protein